MGVRVRLIWCQGGNPASARLAIAAGWWYGFRSDSNHHAKELGPVALVDSHWLPGKVVWPRHLGVVAQWQPWLATVPDTLDLSDLDRTIRQAEEIVSASPHTMPLVIPKCPGLIERLPRTVNGQPLILGYSVPTSYGGTELGLWDFTGWPVHLLGGNTRTQLELCGYLSVVSADGNLPWRLARRGVVITTQGVAGKTLRELDGQRRAENGAHLESLRRSLLNLRPYWDRHQIIDWRPGDETQSTTPGV
jgi:hypothetical protein